MITALLMASPVELYAQNSERATSAMVAFFALAALFFLIRPEIWRRLFFTRVDPRPAALLRITFGIVVLWTFLDLLMWFETFFTDQGFWLPGLARQKYGGWLKVLWDPEHGFEHWWSFFYAQWSQMSILHMRADPPFVMAIYALQLAAVTAMIFGVATRWTTIAAWFLTEQLYRYSSIYYTGGDTVIRVFLFLGMFCQWGQAYSFDSWWKRRRAIRTGARHIPALETIAAWPQRLMMLQLAIIYSASGILKSGATWMHGSALYYALNLDHFYRVPATGLITSLHKSGVLVVSTIVVHFWEMLFPIVLVGVMLTAYERDRRAGTWSSARRWRRWLSWAVFAAAWAILAYVLGLVVYHHVEPKHLRLRVEPEVLRDATTALVLLVPLVLIAVYTAVRRWLPRFHRFLLVWLMGRRTWLVFGVAMHIGIDISMNVGTFAQVMMVVYFAWLTGSDLDRAYAWFLSRPLEPGEGERPLRKKAWQRWLLGPVDRLRFRQPGSRCTVRHAPDEGSVRAAAMVRLWDSLHRLDFEQDAKLPAQTLEVTYEGRTVQGGNAALALSRALPGLWPVRWLVRLLGGHGAAQSVGLRLLGHPTK